jgi:regulator of protease activity HflC (stomatin/prohibitin superfamily)
MFRKTIKEHEIGVLWRQGQILGTIAPGRYWLGWDRKVETFDTRVKLLLVPAQEIASADKIAVKVSLKLEFALVDPVINLRASENSYATMYSNVLDGLRAEAVAMTAEELLEGARQLEKQLIERLTKGFDELGYELKGLVVRDIILPRRLRDAYAAELAARTEGKARLEVARAQTAALRNLANAAELAAKHPELLQLLALQAADKADNPNVSVELKQG